MTQETIDAIARNYEPLLHDHFISYDEKVGYMTAKIEDRPDVKGWTRNAVRLYAGYIVASGLRTAPPKPNVAAIMADLI